MTIYDYLLLIVVWIIGAVYGWYARERHAKRTIERLVTEILPQTEESNSRIHVSIQKHNGVFYVYDKEKNQFMAQGSTRKELETNLATRYPNKYFAATNEDLKVFNEPL
jgi:hypothetical protein